MRVLKVLAINLVAPLIGFSAAIYAFKPDIEVSTALSAITGWGTCAIDFVGTGGVWSCAGPQEFGWLGIGSILTFAFAIALLLMDRIAAGVLGVHRSVLALTFAPYTLLKLLIVAVVGLANIGILGVTVFLAAVYWVKADMTWVLVFLALSALSLAWALISQVFAFFTARKTFSPARPISLYEHPRLGLLIREVAKKTNGRMPDNVILGLEPTFFATNAPVQTPYFKRALHGQTLHLSLPLMNLFSAEELKAVIGHELGHFSGQDTQYSMRFAPALAGLHGAVERIRTQRGWFSRLVGMPAESLLDDFAALFGSVHGRISRERELRADKLGAAAASPQDIAYSLLKSSVGGSTWQRTIDGLVERAQKGRFSRNLVRNFTDQIRYDIDREKLSPALQFALGEHIRHPTDSHPTTEARISSLGLSIEETLNEQRILERFFNTKSATSVLDNLTPVEEDLTTLYYHILSGQWSAQAPKERDMQEIFLCLVGDFLARMVTADGEVDDREIATAEEVAGSMFGDFDREGFRERCRNPQDIPELSRMIELANKLLTKEGAANLKSALRKVSEADGKVLEAELALLQQIDDTLNPTDEEPKA